MDCDWPELVGLSRTSYSGWSTSVFQTQRYADQYLIGASAECQPPGDEMKLRQVAICALSAQQVSQRCSCMHVFERGLDAPVGVELRCFDANEVET